MAAHTTRILGGARRRSAAASPAVLGLLAVLLAASGVWMHRQARDVRADPAVRNTALTDSAATSEVKGAVADMVGRLFSYTYTDPGRTDTEMQRELVAFEGGAYDPTKFLKPETVAAAVANVVATPPDGHVHEVVLRPAGR